MDLRIFRRFNINDVNDRLHDPLPCGMAFVVALVTRFFRNLVSTPE